MKERPLYPAAATGVIYRFLWLRTFHAPIAIRVSQEAQRASIVTKKSDGTGGYQPGMLVVDDERRLTEEEWTSVAEIVRNVSFWTARATSRMGLDGASWLLEGVKDGKYHVIDEWSPREGPAREFGLALLELSGLTESPVY